MMMVVPIWILYRYKMGKRNASQQIDWWHTISYYYINFNNLVHKCLKFVLITLILRLMIPRHGDNDTSSSKPTAAPLCRLVNRCQPEEEACLDGSFMYKRWRWRLYFILFPGYHVLFRISHIHRGMVQTPMKISYSGRDTLWRFINCSSPSLSTLFKFITHPLTTTWKESDTLEIILSHPRRLTISLMFSWHFLLSCSTFEKHPTPTHQQSLPLQSSPTLAKSYGGAIWFPLFFFPIGGHPSPFHSQKLFYPLHHHRMAECPMSGRY